MDAIEQDEQDEPLEFTTPREELWQVVKEVHGYLHDWLHKEGAGPWNMYKGTSIEFNANEWGWFVEGEKCEVCLAGLWYLQKQGLVLDLDYDPTLEIANFLDALRWADKEHSDIKQYLGVEIPLGIGNKLVGGIYSSRNPEHIVLFLGWLLEQKE